MLVSSTSKLTSLEHLNQRTFNTIFFMMFDIVDERPKISDDPADISKVTNSLDANQSILMMLHALTKSCLS